MDEYNEKVLSTNALLAQALEGRPNCQFWSHFMLIWAEFQLYGQDGLYTSETLNHTINLSRAVCWHFDRSGKLVVFVCFHSIWADGHFI